METPTGITSLDGVVDVSGDRSGFGEYAIEMRLDDDKPWITLQNFSSEPDWDCMEQSGNQACDEDAPQDNEEAWSVNWDTAEESNGERLLPDGRYTIELRLVGENGYVSDTLDRDVIIDNDPPAPELILSPDLIISQNGS